MTILAPDHTRADHDSMILRLDPASLALLRALSTGRALHPVFGGAAGSAARRRLIDQGAIAVDGSLHPDTARLLAPMCRPDQRLDLRARDPHPRHRSIWSSGADTTSATVGTDGTVVLSRGRSSDLGSDLVTWLGIRPLPALEHRRAWSGEAGDPCHPGARAAWIVERRRGARRAIGWVAAIDAGRDGWRLARGATNHRGVTCAFEPVGVAEVYVALGHLV